MDNPTQSTPAGTAPAAAPVTPPAGAAPAAPASATTPTPDSRPDVKSVMATLTSEQRLLVATGKADKVVLTPEQKAAAKQTAPATAPTPPAAPVAAAPATEPTPAAGAEPTATPTEPQGQTPEAGDEGASPTPGDEGDGRSREGKRYRFSSEEDQAIAQIAKSKGVSLLEAARIYEGDKKPATTPAEPVAPGQPPATPPVAADPIVSEIDAKIAANKARLEAAIKERNKAADDLDNAKMVQLNDEITDLKTDTKLLENEKQGHLRAQEQQQRQGWEAEVSKSRDRVLEAYPVFQNEDSMERLALDTFVNRAIKDPARKAMFSKPDWPEKLAKEFAESKGIKPKAAAAGTPPATPVSVNPPAPPKPAALPRQQPQQVQPAGAKLLTGANGNQPAPRTITREDAISAVRSDPQARRAIREQLFHHKPGSGR